MLCPDIEFNKQDLLNLQWGIDLVKRELNHNSDLLEFHSLDTLQEKLDMYFDYYSKLEEEA